MRTVHIRSGIVSEIIPEYALPVSEWYGEKFASECMTVSNDVKPGMVYDREMDTFKWPAIEPNKETMIEEQCQALSDRQDFLEDCIIEMAQKVYE